MSQAFCFIGNSHLAAMKLGWNDLRSRYPSVEIDFFGSHREKLKETGLNNGRIEPLNPKVRKNFMVTAGLPAIEIAKYDRIFIVGADFSFETVAELYRQFGVWSFKGRQPQLISRDCFQRAGRGLLEATAAMHIMRLIRTASDLPILISPQPFLAEPHRSATISNNVVDIMVRAHDGKAVHDIFECICEEMMEDGLTIQAQPQHTRTNIIYTKARYSGGSVRLNRRLTAAHSKWDRRHMNAHYGAEVISSIFADLKLETRNPAPSLARLVWR